MNDKDYLDQLRGFRRLDEERDVLIKELVANCHDLTERLEKKCKEFDDVVQTRNLYQTQANEANKKLVKVQHEVDMNSFVFAVIDGNEAPFWDVLMSMGEEGGVLVANKLHTSIKKHLRTVYSDKDTENWHIIVQVFIDLEDRSREYCERHHTESANTVREFARGFNCGQVFFSIIDVRKEQTSSRLLELARLKLSNPQCKHIIVGPWYIMFNMLQRDNLPPDPRIALLETSPITREVRGLGYRTVSFHQVFGPKFLPKGPSIASPPSPQPKIEEFVKVFENSLDLIETKQEKASDLKYYLVNSSGERVDEPTPAYKSSAAQRVDGRGRGPCYRYHIAGACDVSSCTYYHGERLGPDEQLLLRDRARSFLCIYGSSCNSPDCFWGHHCKYGKECRLQNCCFGDDHGATIDPKPVEKVYEDGSREKLPA